MSISNMEIFDSHCHPQFPQYDEDREEMIRRALDAGIRMICVGTDAETSEKAIGLAGLYEGVWASVGLHPNDNPNEGFDEKKYEKLLGENKVIAMGEVGLDYYRTEGAEDQERQKDRFIRQLELSQKIGKPLILHCRDARAGSTGRAYPDMIDILRSASDTRNSKPGGVIHSYTGSLEEAKRFLDLGMYLGFNGIITFARQYDEIVKYAPLDRILLETDAPYLTPEPYRGQRNEPLYVTEVAKKIAEIKNISVEDVVVQTTKNTIHLFSLDPNG
ncbi:MAG: TatD family hydrolase [Candidatus Yanofskybacteria bacterium]|nr:TatD family hydrolase [Candidatus Yanofskybacteria bacterium]